MSQRTSRRAPLPMHGGVAYIAELSFSYGTINSATSALTGMALPLIPWDRSTVLPSRPHRSDHVAVRGVASAHIPTFATRTNIGVGQTTFPISMGDGNPYKGEPLRCRGPTPNCIWSLGGRTRGVLGRSGTFGLCIACRRLAAIGGRPSYSVSVSRQFGHARPLPDRKRISETNA